MQKLKKFALMVDSQFTMCHFQFLWLFWKPPN